MRNGGTIVLFGLIALLMSWGAMVVTPVSQLGQLTSYVDKNTNEAYPVDRPGMAKKGAEVYRSLGCAECHTRYATQDNLRYGARIKKIGDTNETVRILLAIRNDLTESQAKGLLTQPLPIQILKDGDRFPAERAKKLLEEGAKCEVEYTVHSNGRDLDRGWGVRQTVARDYIYDNALALGSLRVGPDLANIGSRDPQDFVGAWQFISPATNALARLNERRQWHLAHLYSPQIKSPDSTMPGYKFLFKEVDEKLHTRAKVDLPAGAAPAGKVIVPTVEANALVEWLVSQQPDKNLTEFPVQAPLP